MLYYSTNNLATPVDFKQATIQGQPPDKGLYFPEQIPVLEKEWIAGFKKLSNEEIAFTIIRPYVGGTIPDERLFKIVGETVNFPIPLVQVSESISSLELFHGPTLAFKDVGARFMSRCLGHFVQGLSKKVTVLVATSGDTGGAVANGFYEVEGVEVVILYPSGKVSPVQEKQLTALGKNIRALEVSGSFDDCQDMVKKAFTDTDLRSRIFLTSANSINVARWLPQQFYYFFALKQWPDWDHLPVISVPSGNFGNICAGILAHRSGLPVKHFIAACNINNSITKYLNSDGSQPPFSFTQKAVPTLSNAMDVGNPSNFVRILELFHHRFEDLKSKLSSFSITDEETIEMIGEVYRQYGYLLDPHGAVGYLALRRYIKAHPGEKGIFLETAHPVKFPASVEKIIGHAISIPGEVQVVMSRPKQSIAIPAKYEALKNLLLE